MRSQQPSSIRPKDKTEDRNQNENQTADIDASEAEEVGPSEDTGREEITPTEEGLNAEAECVECAPENAKKFVRSPGTRGAHSDREEHERTY